MTTTPPESVDPADLDAEVQDRLAAQVAAALARREQRQQQRAELTERRTAGLRRRHARKLSNRPSTTQEGTT